jgi:hypothetical protein
MHARCVVSVECKFLEKHDIVSDFALKYLSEPPRRLRQSTAKASGAKGKVAAHGPVVAPIVVEKPVEPTRVARE